MHLIAEYKLSYRDAWGFTMREYNELCNIKNTKPAERVYDKDAQDRILSRHEVRAVING